MAGDMELLGCPLCSFSVRPDDNYVLQLHFEQVHTEDSPFRIENDPEPLPPPLPPRPSSMTNQQQQAPTEEDTPSDSEDENSVLCPEPDCGELILLCDFNDHLDLHAAATLSFDEATGKYHSRKPSAAANMRVLASASSYSKGASKEPSFLEQNFDTNLPEALRNGDNGHKLKKKVHRSRGDSGGSEKSTLSRNILSFNPFARLGKQVKPPQGTARLGRTELGPYAWEDRMPKWLHEQLANGPKITTANRIGRDGRLIKQEQVQNETPGIIPILAQLSALDRSVKAAYYCHPSTIHVGKTPREGGFCGYRNIQMLVSYIQGARAQGQEEFPGRTPGILRLQDMIERAWDKGINEIGRQQTGGIRDTRKYIGTPEAQALFLSSEIDCAVEMFTDSPDGSTEAHEQLLYAVESYFAQAAIKADSSNVYKTLLPPIYLQQPGHSITIIGFERRRDGSCNLMTFDPMYHTSPEMHRLVGRKNIKTARPEVMYAYRRVAKQLRKHAAFEVLMLTAHPPMFPAWDILHQYPDCRFVYAFFRSKTLGYDVYPEDHFLRNFPWQQYGGLWIIDDARFARGNYLNPRIAQALRQVTGEGASTGLSCDNSMQSSPGSLVLGSFCRSPCGSHGSCGNAAGPNSSCAECVDGSKCEISMGLNSDPVEPVLDMIGMHPAQSQRWNGRQQPTLSLQIPQKKFPGYPSPSSPTPDAKIWFPSPSSNCGSAPPTPRVRSPMDIDGFRLNGHHIHSPRSASISSASPMSPTCAISPRSAMVKNMCSKQALHNMGHHPSLHPFNSNSSASTIVGATSKSSRHATHLPSTPVSSFNSQSSFGPSPSWVPIANGVETSDMSPFSPSGTVLRYTSNRAPESGLLALRPLSEPQVAEYRFWRPCGKRGCAFGCGQKDEGEIAAAKRLFRGEEVIKPIENDGESSNVPLSTVRNGGMSDMHGRRV